MKLIHNAGLVLRSTGQRRSTPRTLSGTDQAQTCAKCGHKKSLGAGARWEFEACLHDVAYVAPLGVHVQASVQLYKRAV